MADYTGEEESQTWLAFRAGSQPAYAHLYQQYFARLYNYGAKFTADKNLIEDSIQDLFVKLWQNRERLADPPSIRNYLFKSLRHTLFNKLVGQRFLKQPEDWETYQHLTFTLSPETSLIQDQISQERGQQLAKALQSLTPRQQEALFLKFYEGLSYEEIAQVMAISVKATYKLMYRALELMRHLLQPALLHSGILFWLLNLR